jgi:hypothetical protein
VEKFCFTSMITPNSERGGEERREERGGRGEERRGEGMTVAKRGGKERGQEKRGKTRKETCIFAFACSLSHFFLSRSFSASDGIGWGVMLPNCSRCPRRSPANEGCARVIMCVSLGGDRW